MFIRFAVTAVATVFLGAAAWAVVPYKSESAVLVPLNSSTLEKNSSWPIKGQISLDPCEKVACVNA